MFKSNLAVTKKPPKQNQLNLMKYKSVDDRKRLKLLKKIKSMNLKHSTLMNDPCLVTNFPPAAGRKLDTIYNKTLSLL